MSTAILSVISGADTWDDMENWGHAKKGMAGKLSGTAKRHTVP